MPKLVLTSAQIPTKKRREPDYAKVLALYQKVSTQLDELQKGMRQLRGEVRQRLDQQQMKKTLEELVNIDDE